MKIFHKIIKVCKKYLKTHLFKLIKSLIIIIYTHETTQKTYHSHFVEKIINYALEFLKRKFCIHLIIILKISQYRKNYYKRK